MDFRVCAFSFLFFFFFRFWSKTDKCGVQIDSKEVGLTYTVMSSPTSKPVFESSNSGRNRRPRDGVRCDFSKSFECGDSKTQL